MSKRGQVFGMSFIVMAGALFALWQFGLSGLLAARDAKHWQETSCTVLSSTVERYSRGRRRGVIYLPAVTYEYTFAGKTYTSERIRPGIRPSMGTRSSAQSLADKYPEGSDTVCYVPPDRPAEAVLEQKVGSDVWIGVFVPLGVFAGGVFMMVAAVLGKVR